MAISALNAIPTFDYFAAQLAMPGGTPGLISEVFRDASQSQNVSQSSRAFSGATAANTMADVAELSQEATALNLKDATINPAIGSGPNGGEGGRISQIVIGGDQLARAADVLAQNQGGDQTATASLQDAQGNPSESTNELSQNGELNTALNALSELNVNMPTNLMSGFPSFSQVSQGLGTIYPPLNMEFPDMSIAAAPAATEEETPAVEAEAEDEGAIDESADADAEGEEKEHVLNVVFPSLSVFLRRFEDAGVKIGSSSLTTAAAGPDAGASSPYQYHASIWPISFIA